MNVLLIALTASAVIINAMVLYINVGLSSDPALNAPSLVEIQALNEEVTQKTLANSNLAPDVPEDALKLTRTLIGGSGVKLVSINVRDAAKALAVDFSVKSDEAGVIRLLNSFQQRTSNTQGAFCLLNYKLNRANGQSEITLTGELRMTAWERTLGNSKLAVREAPKSAT